MYLLWEQDVAGSSPVAYTNISVRKLAKRLHLGCSDLFVSSTLTLGTKYNGGLSLIAKAEVLKTSSSHVIVMCGLESHILLSIED